MKRLLISTLACLMVWFSAVGMAQAQPLIAITMPWMKGPELTAAQQALLEKLDTEILPQIQAVLTPEQRETFQAAVEEGVSFRKAFKSIALSPTQKGKLGAMFKSLPTQDVFASLTPEQKKQFFMKKKEFFMPTPKEIADKIGEKMKLAKDKVGVGTPTAEEIGEKISEKMKQVKTKLGEAEE